LLALSLAGCTEALSLVGGLAGGMAGGPATVADRTTLDERAALGIETGYQVAAQLALVAFQTGFVAPSQDADVQRDNFCEMVVAGLAVVTDRGGQIAALDCRAHHAVTMMRRAYDAGNAASFAVAFAEARRLVTEMTSIIAPDGNGLLNIGRN
jgi:hypothetical protein